MRTTYCVCRRKLCGVLLLFPPEAEAVKGFLSIISVCVCVCVWRGLYIRTKKPDHFVKFSLKM